MNDIVPFTFESHTIRTITDENGEPWLVLTDVLVSINTTTTTTGAISSIKQGLGDGYVSDIPIMDNLGRKQHIKIIAEPAATYLLSRSNTDKGRKLNRYIHSEVLPSIRKTGKYETHPQPAQLTTDKKLELLDRIRGIAAEEGDEMLRVMALDAIKNAVIPEVEGRPKQLPETPSTFQVFELLEQLGVEPKDIRSKAAGCGKVIAAAYRRTFGTEPPVTARVIDGAKRSVKCYPMSWYDEALAIVKAYLNSAQNCAR